MKRILLLSDSHSYIDESILSYAESVDEIWHAGDFGSQIVIDKLRSKRKLVGVYGNIDNVEIRTQFPEVQRFVCEEVDVLMIHIGGYPKKYVKIVKEIIEESAPKLFISGHSHILKVMFDDKNHVLHFNPGACGKYGWHKKRTMLRFSISGKEIENLEIIELGDR